MDIFEELENMAINAANDDDEEFEPSEEEILRWQALFAYSYAEAVEQIKNQRSDYTRYRVSDEHWALIRSELEPEGFSREAHEHWMKLGRPSASDLAGPNPTATPPSQANASYLILLEGILNTPETIKEAAQLSELPEALAADSEDREGTTFCRIDFNTKQAIERWLSQQKSSFRPTFVRLTKANKNLDPNSTYPTLGVESTLPQHRLTTNHTCPVQQETYPVYYFFYGTLADPDTLTRYLSLPESESPEMIPARIYGGSIKTWGAKYKALVDGASTDYVFGSAYKVTTKEREEALMFYETDKYDVVRCSIMMENQTVQGLTFRVVGSVPLSSDSSESLSVTSRITY